MEIVFSGRNWWYFPVERLTPAEGAFSSREREKHVNQPSRFGAPTNRTPNSLSHISRPRTDRISCLALAQSNRPAWTPPPLCCIMVV
jgi:hypothetical protein